MNVHSHVKVIVKSRTNSKIVLHPKGVSDTEQNLLTKTFVTCSTNQKFDSNQDKYTLPATMMLRDKAGHGSSGRGTNKVMAVVIKVEVVAAKREVAVVKAGVALTKVVIEEVYLDVLNSAPPCRRCCQPQGLVLPMLLPQVLYTAVARAEVGVAKAGVVVVQAEAYASRAKVVVALSFLLPAPPCHQRPHPTRKAVAIAAGIH